MTTIGEQIIHRFAAAQTRAPTRSAPAHPNPAGPPQRGSGSHLWCPRDGSDRFCDDVAEKLNRAIADVVNAFMALDLIKVWGDGSVAAADGTQVDTFIENLRAD